MESVGDQLSADSPNFDMRAKSTPQLFVNGFHCDDTEFETFFPHHHSFGEP